MDNAHVFTHYEKVVICGYNSPFFSAPPSAPTITSLTNIYSDQLTVTWTSVPMTTSYNVSINGSTPISLPANANTYTFTGLTNSTVYTVSVVAINCAGTSRPAVMTGRTGTLRQKIVVQIIINRDKKQSDNGNHLHVHVLGQVLYELDTMN